MDLFMIDSDTDEYTESSDSEELEERETIFSGHAQDILTSLDESILKIDDFLSFERGFSHGDIVSHISDPSGQLGRVVDIDMVVDLESQSGKVLRDVNSKRLVRVRSFMAGDYVIMGSWIGRVNQVIDLVKVVFNDGTKCEILVKDPDMLVPVMPGWYEEMIQFYYPGQRVRMKNASTGSKTAKWLCGDWGTKNSNEGTVCSAEAGLVQVYWISSLSRVWGSCKTDPTPSSLQEPKNLTLLSCFQDANWQLGDWCTLLDMASAGAPKSSVKMVKNYGQGSSGIFTISKTRTTIDVLWQNGLVSVGMDPRTVAPISNLGDHDFWPEQFVLEKAIASEEACTPKFQRVGVVKKVDALERTVKVKWGRNQGGFVGDVKEETVSAYELVEHPDFSFCVGEVVVRLVPSLDKVEEAKSGFDSLLCFGNFVGHKEGGVEVKWANGVLSKVDPFEICGLERLLDIVSPQPVSEVITNATDSTRFTDEQEDQGSPDDPKILDESSYDCVESLRKATARLFPKAAFDFLSDLFGRPHVLNHSGMVKEETNNQVVGSTERQLDANETTKPEPKKLQKEAAKPNETSDLPVIYAKPREFKRFDVIDECTDHYFTNQTGSSLVKKGWLKKIQQEWSILENNLPESIYVRACEERMDLLRACIIGAAGTPYHDGLFFFDIFFPADYPHEPPLVHYHSGGLRLNPNLYESGKVCLSLLNTWTGSGTEVWDPKSSTVLQVLLSLQALVLNEKPYFNEAGYDKQVGRADGEKNSVTYNENAFLLSCKSMMYLIQKPPKHFEDFIREHFTCHAPRLITACKAYLDGAQVGSLCKNEEPFGACHKSCSTGFKLMLAKLLPKLVSTFTEMGIDCNPSNPLAHVSG
ncbi:Ubiquitin-conjugating enzyme family protein [Rhynchospora pubera]|uniref:E2 ubiquitin-conjugating enzyme n=1 Tax=Rhynchospora pubera TaxID=906938 RepID=A0AAV8C1P3_9POAL|nr:Ubiquitin-conjugating enzyme family protein [Rhynchospora pubera]